MGADDAAGRGDHRPPLSGPPSTDEPGGFGPRANRVGTWARWSWSSVRFGVGPGAGWRRRAASPPARARLSQPLTAAVLTARTAAMSVLRHPPGATPTHECAALPARPDRALLSCSCRQTYLACP
jgi:hypothetical protein